MFDMLSDSHNWDFLSLQEPHVDPDLTDFDEFHNSVDRPETWARTVSDAVGPPLVVPPAPRRTQTRPRWHIPSRHLVHSNTSSFHAAVVIHSRRRANVRWFGTCEFAAGALVGSNLIMSAYLPHPGHGLTLYREALASFTCFVKSVPRCFGSFKVVLGCDANAQLIQHESTPGVVGPRSSPSSADPERSRELLRRLYART